MRKLRLGAIATAAALVATVSLTSAGHASERDNRILAVEVPEFSAEVYRNAVEKLFSAYEERTGRALRPGEKGRVGLKIYTGSGPGLATPVDLVRATLAALQGRGYEAEDLFLIDLSEVRLRRAGFLPSFATGGSDFEGHPVYVLDSGRHYDSGWYYDNPLPPQREPLLARRNGPTLDSKEDRKSYLPAPLLFEVDFWINLPVYTDHPVLGISGALVNGTLANSSNALRFSQSEANGPVAVAEMAAIPELRDTWKLNIASLERFQFAGGTRFHSLYTASRPLVVLSGDPVLLDAFVRAEIDEWRGRRGLDTIDEHLPMFEYASQLGLGNRFFTKDRIERIE